MAVTCAIDCLLFAASGEALSASFSRLVIDAGAPLGLVGAMTFVRDKPIAGAVQQQSIWRSLGIVVRNRRVWLNAGAGSGTTASLLGFAGLWGVLYFETYYEIDQATAAAMTSIVLI
jgi:hypothetical protein